MDQYVILKCVYVFGGHMWYYIQDQRVAVPVYPHVKVEWSHVCTSPAAAATSNWLLAY